MGATVVAAKLKGRVALITGAGRGIGRAIALRFASEGAFIAAVARSQSELDSLVNEIQKAGGRAVAIPADLSERSGLNPVVSRCLEAFGTVDILVNSAGVGSSLSPKPLVDFDDNFWDFTLALNLTAPYLLTKAVLPILIAKKSGRIINIASVASRIGLVHGGAYAASKHGLLGLTRTAALEVAADGITVNAICPGPVRTRLSDLRLEHEAKRLGRTPEELARQSTPIGRRLEPEEISGTALLLASDESRAITGQAIDVCGGLFMA
jgi:NAD(P)-dependent dehydrogenase (short-subunit alcohol dehydrogenase family)